MNFSRPRQLIAATDGEGAAVRRVDAAAFAQPQARLGHRRLEAAAELLDQERVTGFLALSYLVLVLLPALVVALCLLARVPVIWWAGPVVAAGGVLALGRGLLGSARRAERRFAVGLLLGSLLLVGVVCATLDDISSDGATYHTEAVLGLEHGINPVTTAFHGPMQMWTNHFAKLTWYYAADVARVTGEFQLGKSYTLVLVLGCWAYAWNWFRRMGMRPREALLLATATAANPVAMSQMVSMYLDGALAALVTMAVLACAGIVFMRRRLDGAVLALVSVMLVSIKFTGVAYLGVLLALTAGAIWVRARGGARERIASLKPVWLAVVAAAVLGVGVIGFNPYLTNVAQGHNPMYPLAGAGKYDIMAHHQSPREFIDPHRNRVENLVTSIMSRSRPGLEEPSWKVPFTTSFEEIRAYAAPDVHLAGWGVFFSGVLLVSVVMYLWRRGWRSAPAAGFAAVAVIVTVLINPYAWLARYVPQLALLPVLLLVPWMLDERIRAQQWARRLAAALCVFMLLDAGIAAGLAMLASAVPTLRFHRILTQVARECGPGQYVAYPVPGDMPYHYEPYSGYRGITIESAAEGARLPAGAKAYPFGVSWGRVELVRTGGCDTER